MEWLTGYWTRWVHLRAKGYILIFDRTYLEAALDSARSPDGSKLRLASALWWLLPKPDLVFVLATNPDVRGDSEEDRPPSELTRERQVNRVVVSRLAGGQVISASLPTSLVVDEIQRVVRAWMRERSAASLGEAREATPSAPSASERGGRKRGAHSLEPR
jgi:hypothetical protein